MGICQWLSCVGMASILHSTSRAGFGSTLAIFLFFSKKKKKKSFSYLYPEIKLLKKQCSFFSSTFSSDSGNHQHPKELYLAEMSFVGSQKSS